ncbi:hypothetical protein Nepgr_023008 [Nepenthes gracilis]|uniref:Uncharacterized protein n=1 Tax=Nepenthes gracilis TaxID=150966 RepID=A0AAD3XYY5_NEPGR|nr:hypothetical protein Nepgr_023008 [Nepenthes gracilis]
MPEERNSWHCEPERFSCSIHVGSSATAGWLGDFLLFCGCKAWDDPDADGCWLGMLILYKVVNATFDVEPYAATVAVRFAWRWKAPDFLSPAC